MKMDWINKIVAKRFKLCLYGLVIVFIPTSLFALSPKTDSAVFAETDIGNADIISVLSPPDLSSPRATIQSFIKNMNKSHQILTEAHRKNLEGSGLFVADGLKDEVDAAEEYFEKATYCLDLSAFAPSIRKDLGYSRAILLKEILDRLVSPPFEEIPDLEQVNFDLENNKYPHLNYWTIPGTEITLVRTENGILQGKYLFSAETIEKLPDFYNEIKHFPYRSDEYVSKDFYLFYISTPGQLMPPRWHIYLPEWSNRIYLSQTIWQWVALIVSVILAAFVIFLLHKLLYIRWKNKTHILKNWKRALFYILSIFIVILLNNFIRDQINVTGNALIVSRIILESVFWLLLTFLSFSLLIAISDLVVNTKNIDKIGIEATYTRAVFMVLAILLATIVIIYGLSALGVAIVPLLTGVGIGGIALALAARSTLENIIASFTIFIDKPYRVGNRVKVMDYNGTIESIGLRSTQIRLLTGPLVSIPNEKMASIEIENIQERPYLRREFDIRIKHESTQVVVEKSVQIIKDILSLPNLDDDEWHPNRAINNKKYPPRVFFNKINTDSFNIYVSYWHFPPVHWEFMKHAEAVNIQIINRLNEASIDFAFPTQMMHFKEDMNVNAQIGDTLKQ